VSSGVDPRLGRFVRGELSSDEIAELETDLDRRPSLRLALAEYTRETASFHIGEAREQPSRPVPAPTRGPAMHEGPERLAVGSTLGQGGMGTVRQGVQTNLGRAVAVKTLRDETPSGTHRLLQEARLTARLQHPNIVPVHEIIEGHSGELQIVLKQVEGELWGKVMHDPELLRTRFGVEDALDWNLGVLVAICNALAYAHERGVIHRDIKPSNVMVGNFGEIYLLDWGIAAFWGERTDHELAHVEDAPIAGTLQYMAPEQLEGDADALGPWTDIYLLGATLYEVLGRRPPHADAHRSDRPLPPRRRVVPPLGPDAPRELVEIALASLRPDPEDRVPTPQAFRGLIEAFRSHRGSLELVEQAERSRKRATEAWDAGKRADVERHLGEAELGFRAALEAWPDNARARSGIGDVAVQRIDAALSDGHFQVARRLLEALVDPPAALVQRVERATSAEEEKLADATRAAWHRNPTVGVFVRSAVLALFAPAWVLGWLVAAIWPPASTWSLVALLLGYLALGTVVVLSQGLAMLRNQLNRSNLLGAAAAVVAALAWTLAAGRLQLPMVATQLGILLVFALTATVVAVTSDLRGLPPAAASVGCFVLAALAPAYARHALAASALLMSAGLVLNNVLMRRRLKRTQ
jgi:serine/threonine-protein kinase